jgi:hypothetical protein
MLVVAKMMGQFAVERAFDQGFGQLLEQTVLTEQVVRLFVILQQLIEQFGCEWHNLSILSRLGC